MHQQSARGAIAGPVHPGPGPVHLGPGVSQLPADLVSTVARFAATAKDLGRLRAVCKIWRQAVHDEIWMHFALRSFQRVQQLAAGGTLLPVHVSWEQVFREQLQAEAAKVEIPVPPLSAYFFTFELTVAVGNQPPTKHIETFQLTHPEGDHPGYFEGVFPP